MQSLLTVETPEGVHARGWLHRAAGSPDTCVVIVHGHNAWGRRSRFITIAKWLEHHGYDAVRWDCNRTEIKEKTFGVLPISTEAAQVRALLQKLRPQYKRLVLVGHSQGGLISLLLATEGLCDALVQLMPVVDTRESVRDKLHSIGVSLDDFHANGSTNVTYPNGETFVYDATYFDDLATHDAKELYKHYNKPLLMVGGTLDVTIPLTEVEDGFSWANEPKELLVLDETHNFTDEAAAAIAQKIHSWLRT